MTSIFNACDCSANGNIPYTPYVPKPFDNCVGDCSNNDCSSFDKVATERRIQNQSRVSQSLFVESYKAVTVANNRFAFKGGMKNLVNMSSQVWGTPNNLRNQSDRTTPSRSGAWTSLSNRNQAFGVALGKAGYVNVPTRGNSLRSTITGNRPGAMTPGGQGVDVKHGSYDRYLAKKKGKLLTKSPPFIPTPLLPYRLGPQDPLCPKNPLVCPRGTSRPSSTMNNMSYKFSLVSVPPNCPDCDLTFWFMNDDPPITSQPGIMRVNSNTNSIILVTNDTQMEDQLKSYFGITDLQELKGNTVILNITATPKNGQEMSQVTAINNRTLRITQATPSIGLFDNILLTLKTDPAPNTLVSSTQLPYYLNGSATFSRI